MATVRQYRDIFDKLDAQGFLLPQPKAASDRRGRSPGSDDDDDKLAGGGAEDLGLGEHHSLNDEQDVLSGFGPSESSSGYYGGRVEKVLLVVK